ncbi:MAG TPA: tetratricopeptide repeat protein [Vicinamibacterales bacterium]|jgi:tetratricopeptide (TPR) repeat protein|nr:tetratricopeptide repeat protein [Vicinamibacterales bacterium]
MPRSLTASLVVTLILAAAPVAAQTKPAQPQKPPAVQPKSDQASASKKAATGNAAEFDRLVAAATEARKAQRWEDAIALYGKVVKLKPGYVEGHWYQGTAYYSLDDYPNCRDTFRKVVRLAPKNGAAFAFLGLCEFGMKDYDRALQHLLQSRILGVGDAPELGSVARYHAGVLMTRVEQFEQALETLGEFTREADDNPRVIEAMGLATLRMPLLPIEMPPDRREMVLMAGRASYLMATRNTAASDRAFEALVARYPETENVHYAYGVFLLGEEPDKAIQEFKRELELQPDHPWSLMQIAYEYLKRGDAKEALTWAQRSVAVAPNVFTSHKALGQALLETGDVDGAIKELLIGIKLAPESPGLHFTLARAYQRAGRIEEATRERDEFTRLDKLARTMRTGAQSVGGR